MYLEFHNDYVFPNAKLSKNIFLCPFPTFKIQNDVKNITIFKTKKAGAVVQFHQMKKLLFVT